MHDTIENIRVLSKLVELLRQAGFGCGPFRFESLLAHLSNEQFCQHRDVFRELYLSSIGLGEFHLKIPEVIDMAGPNVANDPDRFDAVHGIWHQYEACESPILFRSKFRTSTMSLELPLRKKESTVSMEEALKRLKRRHATPGTVWHMQWLFRHQECLPADWIVALKKGRRIVFPGVQIREKDRSDPFTTYPYLRTDCGKIAYAYSRFTSQPLCRSEDFVARIDPVD